MLGWFKRKKPPLDFPDNQAAFDYACEHFDNRVLIEALIPALVEEQGRNGNEGERYFRIRLAAKGGGRSLWACTLKEAVDWPQVGDLVGFRVVMVADDLPEEMNVIGFIAVKLQPVCVPGKGLRVAKSYTPKNIKPTVRW
jgi:hypothetical protein